MQNDQTSSFLGETLGRAKGVPTARKFCVCQQKGMPSPDFLGFRFKVEGLGTAGQTVAMRPGFRAHHLGFTVQDLRVRVRDLGFMGFRI